MNYIEIVAIAIGLAMDAAAVSIANGMSIKKIRNIDALRIAFSFGLFQAAMPILGWALGSSFRDLLQSYDHWIALILLAVIGANMIRGSLSKGCDDAKNCLHTPTLLLMSLATSIDALAAGIGLSLLNINIFVSAFIIGLITFAMSFVFVKVGKRLEARVGKKMEFAGGVILILIGIKIAIEHVVKNI